MGGGESGLLVREREREEIQSIHTLSTFSLESRKKLVQRGEALSGILRNWLIMIRKVQHKQLQIFIDFNYNFGAKLVTENVYLIWFLKSLCRYWPVLHCCRIIQSEYVKKKMSSFQQSDKICRLCFSLY